MMFRLYYYYDYFASFSTKLCFVREMIVFLVLYNDTLLCYPYLLIENTFFSLILEDQKFGIVNLHFCYGVYCIRVYLKGMYCYNFYVQTYKILY